jgi:hypothetical protein
MSELLDVVLQQLMNWTATTPSSNAPGEEAGEAAAADVSILTSTQGASATHLQRLSHAQGVAMLTGTQGPTTSQGALNAAGAAVGNMQGSLQHTQASLDRVGANLTAIQGVLATPNNPHSMLAAQYQALLQERTALQQLYGQLVAEGEAAGTRLEMLLSATRARQQQQQQGSGAAGTTDVSGEGSSAELQQQQRREAARRLLLGGSSSTSSSPTAAGRGGISQLLIPSSSSSSRPVSVAPPTGRLPATQRPPTPDRCVDFYVDFQRTAFLCVLKAALIGIAS